MPTLPGGSVVVLMMSAVETLMAPDVPLMAPFDVSVAVMVWLPLVFSVAEKLLVPLTRVEAPGSTAAPSVLVKATVSAKLVTVLPYASCAVTAKLKATLLVALAGALTSSLETAAGLTVMAPVVPASDEVTVSVAVIVWLPAVLRVAEKLPTPLARVEFAGNAAAASVLVKCTVPE